LLALEIGRGARETTEFFLLGPDGTADAIAAPVEPGARTTMTVGISNHDGTVQAYEVVVESGAAHLTTLGPISVASGETWTGVLDFTVPPRDAGQEVHISLIRPPIAQPYRSLTLQVDAPAPA